MSFQPDLLYSQQLHRSGSSRIDEVAHFSEELQSRSLCDRRQGDRSYWHSPSTRIHQLGDIQVEGLSGDGFEMEIYDPVTGTSAFGICAWFGPRLERVLLKGQELRRVRRPSRQQAVNVGETGPRHHSRRSSRFKPRNLHQEFLQSQINLPMEQGSDRYTPLCTSFAAMAIGSSPEIDGPESTSSPIRR